jgi:peptide deformylase
MIPSEYRGLFAEHKLIKETRMIRPIVKPNNEPCNEVDITLENGLAYSPLQGRECLIWDLIHTVEAAKVEFLTAKHIGYNKKAMALSHSNGVTIMLNPTIKKLSRNNGKYYKTIKVSYYATDGRERTVKFVGKHSAMVQRGLEILGIEKYKK